MSYKQLILASLSPYRKALLEKLNYPFSIDPANIDESIRTATEPTDIAKELAMLKASALESKYPDALSIGCDQVAYIGNTELCKPGNHLAAQKQLLLMQGRVVYFHTGLCLYNTKTKNRQVDVISTKIRFRSLTPQQIEHYLLIEKPYDCAGSAKSEGMGITLMEKIECPDFNSLVGLPLIKLIDFLLNEKVDVLQANAV